MINEQWNKTQNNAPFVAFNDMHAVTFLLPDSKNNSQCVPGTYRDKRLQRFLQLIP